MTIGVTRALNRLLPPYDFVVDETLEDHAGPRNMFVRGEQTGNLILVLAESARNGAEQDLLVYVTPEDRAAYTAGTLNLRALIDRAAHPYLLTRPIAGFVAPQITEIEHADIPDAWLPVDTSATGSR